MEGRGGGGGGVAVVEGGGGGGCGRGAVEWVEGGCGGGGGGCGGGSEVAVEAGVRWLWRKGLVAVEGRMRRWRRELEVEEVDVAVEEVEVAVEEECGDGGKEVAVEEGGRWRWRGGELEVEEVDVAVEGGIWWWSGGGELAVDEAQEGTSLRAPVPDLQS